MTTYGNETVKSIQKWSPSAHVAVLMRHSERPQIHSVRGNDELPLTPSGVEAAMEFGRGLTSCVLLRTFSSPALRCRQTANAIAEGAASIGINTKNLGVHPELGGFFIVNRDQALDKADELEALRGTPTFSNFVRFWFSGEIPEDVVQPMELAVYNQLGFLKEHLRTERRPGVVDIHVSHDWNVMLLREGIFGVRMEEVGIPQYLDGVLVFHKNGKLHASYREALKPVPPKFIHR